MGNFLKFQTSTSFYQIKEKLLPKRLHHRDRRRHGISLNFYSFIVLNLFFQTGGQPVNVAYFRQPDWILERSGQESFFNLTSSPNSPDVVPKFKARTTTPADMEQAIMEPANKEQAIREQANMEQAIMEPVNKEQAIREQANMEQAIMEPTNMEQAIMEPTNKEQAIIRPVNKEQGIMKPANKEQVIIEPTNKEQAIREQANKEQAIMKPVNKEQAIMEPTNKEQAIREQANKEQAIKEPVNKERAIMEPTNFPSDISDEATTPSVGLMLDPHMKGKTDDSLLFHDALKIKEMLLVCLLIETNSEGTLYYDYDKSAAAIDLALEYANNDILPTNMTMIKHHESMGSTCTPHNHAASRLMKLAEEHFQCSVIIGPGCGYSMESMYDVADFLRIPTIGCPAADVGSTTFIGDYTYLTRTSFTHINTARSMIRFFNAYNYTSVMLLEDHFNGFYDELSIVMETLLIKEAYKISAASMSIPFQSDQMTDQFLFAIA
ncbi:hypothetical protein BV898_17825 [Hypsibius exemplaris]|uniref:Receptor ligand binding region domain-containing protein n=1 Tax=Hypsibius exemplaris TaxID=2072580 RepID=A0A9X6NPF8_HYPEX|nr:hypothetical protein BV898_17825 [Hypsibius exemplaris]